MCVKQNTKEDFSYGIIPLRRTPQGWETLLVQHQGGHWAFPKGHPEPGEEPHHSAIRELVEETGLEVVRLFDVEPLEEKYMFRWKEDLIAKTVIYFLAEVQGEVTLQQEELVDFSWELLTSAHKRATFPATRQLCLTTQDILRVV